MTDTRPMPTNPLNNDAPPGDARLEARLAQAARDFTYPPTPDLARAVAARALPRRAPRPRRLVIAGALLALLLAVILAVPPVRAAVLDWIRVGAVRIFLVEPTGAPTADPTPTLPPGTVTPTPRPAPTSTATPLASVLNLAGETTLEAARQSAGFDIRLPAALGQPDRVFSQELGGTIIILVWLDPDRPDVVRHVLFQTDSDGMVFQKVTPRKIADTSVNGRPAVWVDGPYLLITGSGDVTVTRLMNTSHTLVWTAAEMTYRLETNAPLEEAIKIAESMQ